MFDNQIEPFKMPPWIAMIRVGQVTTKDNVLAQVDHLANPEWTSQDTSIGVDTHHDHIINASLFE
jgi:hypothetical protein